MFSAVQKFFFVYPLLAGVEAETPKFIHSIFTQKLC